MKEIHPAMYMSPTYGVRRFRIEDAIDDILIAEAHADTDPSEETTLQRLCRELNITYTETMRLQEAELTRLAALGREARLIAQLREIIEEYDSIPAPFRT